MNIQLFKSAVDFWILIVAAAVLATLGQPSSRSASAPLAAPPVEDTWSRAIGTCGVSNPRESDPPAVFDQRALAPAGDDLATATGEPRLPAANVKGDQGEAIYLRSCATCHGRDGQGMPHQGPALRLSRFIAERDDDQLVAFVRSGRLPNDRLSLMQMFMPPSGGNPALKDADLRDIISHVRRLQASTAHRGNAVTTAERTPSP